MSITPNFYTDFFKHFGHLHNRHVRSLAWLLSSPDIFDHRAPAWADKLAAPIVLDESLQDWLLALDNAPQKLEEYLDVNSARRLGKYAEKLLAFYLAEQGVLFAHNFQIHIAHKSTIGEFDFLLRSAAGLIHWELATKFYLYVPPIVDNVAKNNLHYFVGPNLVDTLDLKMRKTLDQQLMLGHHPSALALLPEPIVKAHALIKGWLFYRRDEKKNVNASNISSAHCRGFWCALADFLAIKSQRFVVLSRLDWLAPARVAASDTLDGDQLLILLKEHFNHDKTPLLIAAVAGVDVLLEYERGFIVPDDWLNAAQKRLAE